jgi:hypothetical protein
MNVKLSLAMVFTDFILKNKFLNLKKDLKIYSSSFKV